MPTGQVAGFKLVPLDTKACSSAGFKTDADALSLYYERGNEEAVAFIKAYLRYNAIKTYLKLCRRYRKKFRLLRQNTSPVYAVCYKHRQTVV